MTRLIFRRCRAKLEPQPGRSYHGRCDLPAGHDGDHLLERGMDELRWSTALTNTARSRLVTRASPPKG